MTASMSAATPTALVRTRNVWLRPSIGIAIASRMAKMIVSRPFGVLKNRIVTREASGRMPLQRWGHQQAFDAVPLQESKPLIGAEREGRCCERIGEHRSLRDDGHAGERGCGRSCPRIDDVMFVTVAGTTPLVVPRSADGAIGHADGVDERAIAARMTDPDGPRGAVRPASSNEEVAARVDSEVGEPR